MTGPATRWVITTLGPGTPTPGELIVHAEIGDRPAHERPAPPLVAEALRRAREQMTANFERRVQDLMNEHEETR